jgi:thioredoxin
MATHVRDVSTAEFPEAVLQRSQEVPVVVDFWAEWCGPCKALTPIVHELAEEFEGKARIAKVDVDANQQIAMQFGIRSIPTVMVFDKGQIVDTLIGVRPKADYEASLNKFVV